MISCLIRDPFLRPTDLKLGAVLAEGKTKLIRTADDRPGHVYLVAKDAITAHNGTRKGQMEGKGVIATTTCAAVFRYLEAVGECRESLQVTGRWPDECLRLSF